LTQFAVLGFNTFRITQMPFVTGACIRTNRGDVPVERLRAGDRVVTASGHLRPIVWIAQRSLDISDHSDPADVRPIRISAGAFGLGLPSRDLWLSPGHSVASAGALIPISRLINERSVAQIDQESVEYWHIELDGHDVLLAEGQPAESYLDCGNRGSFADGGDFIEDQPEIRAKHWAESRLPFVTDGPFVTAVKARLLAELAEQGYAVVGDPDAHILADGRRIEPIWLSDTRLGFSLPAGVEEVLLASKVFVPMHTRADSSDPRELGLCVGNLQIDGDDVALENDELCASGWRPAEHQDGRFSRRWTTGLAPLPSGTRVVIIELAGDGYYWRDPLDNVVTLSEWVGKRDGAREGEI
jgi:hypothetical protein